MDSEKSKEILKQLLLEFPIRETQFSGIDGKTLHFDPKSTRLKNNVDFFITYHGVIYRLEILWEDVGGVSKGENREIDRILMEGYKELKETFEYDDIMTMRFCL